MRAYAAILSRHGGERMKGDERMIWDSEDIFPRAYSLGGNINYHETSGSSLKKRGLPIHHGH
jgi:hypothetical protein